MEGISAHALFGKDRWLLQIYLHRFLSVFGSTSHTILSLKVKFHETVVIGIAIDRANECGRKIEEGIYYKLQNCQ